MPAASSFFFFLCTVPVKPQSSREVKGVEKQQGMLRLPVYPLECFRQYCPRHVYYLYTMLLSFRSFQGKEKKDFRVRWATAQGKFRVCAVTFFDLIRFDTLNWIYNRLRNDNIIKDRMLAGLWPFAIWAHCFEGNFHAPSVFFCFVLLPWLNLCTLQHHHHLVGIPAMTSSRVDIVAFLCVCWVDKKKILPLLELFNSFLVGMELVGALAFVGWWWTSRHRWSGLLLFVPLEYLQQHQKVNDRNLFG